MAKDYMEGKIRHIVFPSVLACLTIFIIATIWNIREYGILFACFGSSAFIVYVKPDSEHASTNAILGAYPLAGFFGYSTIAYLFPHLQFEENINYAIAGGIAVGLTVLAMLLTEFRHAPAGGAALAFVLNTPEVGAVFLLIGGGITLLILAKILTFIVKEEYELEEAVKRTFSPRREGT